MRPGPRRGRYETATWLLLIAFCAVTALLGLSAPQQATSPLGYAAGNALTGGGAALLLARPAREAVSQLLPTDPDSVLHTAALVLSVLIVGTQVTTQLTVDVLAFQAGSGAQLTPLDLVAQELPFLLVALLGVGLFLRRGGGASMTRLGFRRPRWWEVILALAAAGVFYAFSSGVDWLSQHFTPDLARRVDSANQSLFGRLGNPLGIATIALSAGICEEALFRGALQPRLGIVWTSVVFAGVHTQYGLSLDALAVLVLAVALGLIRMLASTTSSAICHIAYNALVGVGVGGSLLLPAVVLEAALLGVLVVVFFRHEPCGHLGTPRWRE